MQRKPGEVKTIGKPLARAESLDPSVKGLFCF